MIHYINEDKRKDLIAQGKRGKREKTDNKTRYEKRTKSHVASTTASFNRIDMESLFTYNILTVNVPVKGETNNYMVRIKFGGILDLIQKQLKTQKLSIKIIIRALLDAFNQEDTYIHCSCPDYIYRFAYWSSIKNINSGPPERRPSKITNPHNDLGSGCKHILLVLANNSWLITVARVIMNYILYMEKTHKKLYADKIYPALYGKKYEEPVQLSIDDDTAKLRGLDDDTEEIDKAIETGRTRGQFKPGNPYRFKPNERPGNMKNQTSMFDDKK